jgi:hypothetical protein
LENQIIEALRYFNVWPGIELMRSPVSIKSGPLSPAAPNAAHTAPDPRSPALRATFDDMDKMEEWPKSAPFFFSATLLASFFGVCNGIFHPE